MPAPHIHQPNPPPQCQFNPRSHRKSFQISGLCMRPANKLRYQSSHRPATPGQSNCPVEFLCDGGPSWKDNILTLVHELFTAGFCPIKSSILSVFKPKKGASIFEAPSRFRRDLDVVVKEKLVGMRTQAQRIVLLAFCPYPHFQKIGSKHVALEQ